jgi:hypothetical protein
MSRIALKVVLPEGPGVHERSKDVASSKPTEKLVRPKPVAITTRMPDARSVRVTGDFTKWSAEGIALEPAGGGEWKAVLKLAPGRYEYRLLVDGQWRDHPEAETRVQNPFGTQNGILTVR